MNEEKCKHKYGWLVPDGVMVYIFDDETVIFNNQGKDRESYKLEARCNNPDCYAVRNVYIKSEVVKWGRIKYRLLREIEDE